jgi:hypothetical protein
MLWKQDQQRAGIVSPDRQAHAHTEHHPFSHTLELSSAAFTMEGIIREQPGIIQE